jgi:hypothetical protein
VRESDAQNHPERRRHTKLGQADASHDPDTPQGAGDPIHVIGTNQLQAGALMRVRLNGRPPDSCLAQAGPLRVWPLRARALAVSGGALS